MAELALLSAAMPPAKARALPCALLMRFFVNPREGRLSLAQKKAKSASLKIGTLGQYTYVVHYVDRDSRVPGQRVNGERWRVPFSFRVYKGAGASVVAVRFLRSSPAFSQKKREQNGPFFLRFPSVFKKKLTALSLCGWLVHLFGYVGLYKCILRNTFNSSAPQRCAHLNTPRRAVGVHI